MHVPVSPEVAFDYFVEPRNRPLWQSSLSRVEEVTGEPRVGQRWIDVTKPGLRPRMETTELERPHRWTEVGTWRGISAELTLEFAPAPGGCEVGSTMRLVGYGPLGWLLTRVSPLAVRADLKKAGALLAEQER